MAKTKNNDPRPVETIEAASLRGVETTTTFPASAATPSDDVRRSGPARVVDDISEAAGAVLHTARSVLPDHRLPVYLTAAALLVTGLLDAPAVVGAALGYEAVRRWGTTHTGPRADPRATAR